MKATLAYSSLTGRVYIVIGKDKIDVTDSFNAIVKIIENEKK